MPYTVGPFDSAHHLVQWGGSLPGGERWSCSFRMAKPGGAVATQAEAIANTAGISAALQSYHQTAGTKIYSLCKMDFVKVNLVDVDGHFPVAGTNELVITPVAGGGSLVAYPNQIALCVTLLTSFTRGPAHAGRFYSPTPSMAMGSDGRISTVDRDLVVISSQQLLTAVNAVSLYKINVFSRKLGAPAHNTVQQTRIGRVLDTQRRRRRSLIEAYV